MDIHKPKPVHSLREFLSVARVHFSEALQQARYEIWRIRITVESARLRGRELGLVANRPKTFIGGYSIPHAICLPMDTPRPKAIEILTRDGSPPWGQPK